SKIGLLILVLGFGGVVETAWSVRQNIGFGPQGCRVLAGRFYGPSFTFGAEQTRPVSAATAIGVDNAFGAVTVRAGEAGAGKGGGRSEAAGPPRRRARLRRGGGPLAGGPARTGGGPGRSGPSERGARARRRHDAPHRRPDRAGRLRRGRRRHRPRRPRDPRPA